MAGECRRFATSVRWTVEPDSLPQFADAYGKGRSMFGKGDKVVYPGHGAAVIDCLVEREDDGAARSYLKLCLSRGLTVMLPVETAAQIGLRAVSTRAEVAALFELLREDEGPMPTTWSRRHRQNVDKVMSGAMLMAGEVIRDLSLMERRAHLSFQEKRLLAKAREVLISELTLSLDATTEHAEATLDAVLAEAR